MAYDWKFYFFTLRKHQRLSENDWLTLFCDFERIPGNAQRESYKVLIKM